MVPNPCALIWGKSFSREKQSSYQGMLWVALSDDDSAISAPAGDAEDMARVVETGLSKIPLPSGVNLPNGVHGPYLHTQDFSALDPGSVLEGQYEDKYYAPDVGLVLTVAPDGTKEVLVSITQPKGG